MGRTQKRVPATQPQEMAEAAAEALAARVEPSERELARRFAHLFFSNAPATLFRERDAATLATMALGAFRFLEQAGKGAVDAQVLNPEDDAEAWQSPVTVIRTRVTERPFIIDTMREYLRDRDLAIEWFLYPVLRVVRDASGRIVELGPAAEGDPRESLAHCEVSRIGDAAQREEIAAAVRRSLEDAVKATDDFGRMVDAAHETIRYLDERANRLPDRTQEIREAQDFLRWIVDGGFVFLGFRSYSIIEDGGQRAIVVDPGSGLGILRDERGSAYAEPVPLDTLVPGLRERVERGPLLIATKTNATSTVHRRTRMDYIGVKKLDDGGRVAGERRFIGLFTTRAYSEDAERIPILREKLRAILADAGVRQGTHDYKEIITIFNSMPKEELFLASAEQIGAEIRTVLQLYDAYEVKVTLRPDPLERGVSVMVILPKERFSVEARKAIEKMLLERLGGTVLNYHLALASGDQARLHFYLGTTPDRVEDVDPEELQHRVGMLIRTWEDRVRLELERDQPPDEARRLAQRYGRAFSAEYQAATRPAVAREDILHLEAMLREGRRESVRLFASEPPDPRRAAERYAHLKLYLIGERLVLSDFMPILDNAGLRVLFVRPFELVAADVPRSTVYLFAVQDSAGAPIDVERQGELLAGALLAVRAGDAISDELNRLILNADLEWRAVDLLRAYCEYAFQIGAVPSRRSLYGALVGHPETAALVVRLFAAKFDPALGLDRAGRETAAAGLQQEFSDALDRVTALAEDRALRRLLDLVVATARTNFYRHGGTGPTFRSGGVPYISLKFSCEALQAIARSRLLFEVWIHSSRMAGVHLRTARVARGGVRLSDRPDDFRTEVLGLVRTQAVKNAVIVPAGSKGGFITRRSPADPGAMADEVAEQYRTLMRGLLDMTDNLVDGRARTPDGVIAWDEPDPYLVVAADKGTAHLPDVANAVAAEYRYWLGDAFASGGSNGYDHKALGITARSAWECVRRHFRELGHDTQTEPFTVIGIGDMSGDVFGNGMLLSRQIRLVATFDHRHIFVDPDPDPEAAYRERERLFQAGRTSWDDYDRAVLSEGGLIVPRGAKSVPLTAQARQALGLAEDVVALDGESLIRAVLCAPADLLWNGGIGTYVKASAESHADVGDSTNDAVRVDARELRVKVVGEGGNLGLTQAARIEYALLGGRINADAIDNSGGVDLSDHEVNLKILLNAAVAEGSLGFDERNELLETVVPEVTELVLRDTRSQSLALSLDQHRAAENVNDFHELMQRLEREGVLDRGAEQLPSLEVLQDRAARDESLTRPELALLLAYSKLWLKQQLLGSGLPDDPAAEEYLHAYFPEAARRATGTAALRGHPLMREIIVTQLVNDLVDLMGAAFMSRVVRDTGATPPEIARAWLIASQLCGARALRDTLAQVELELPAAVVYRWLGALARVLERTARWVLANVASDVPATAVIEEHMDGLGRLREHFGGMVAGEERDIFQARVREMRELTRRDQLAERLITLRFLDQLLEILRVARETGAEPLRAGRIYYLTSDLLEVPWLRQAIAQAARGRWDQRMGQGLLDDLGRAHRALTAAVLRGGAAERAAGAQSVGELRAYLGGRMAADLADFHALLEEIRADGGEPELAALGVAVRELLSLSR